MRKRIDRIDKPRNRKERLGIQVVSLEARRQMVIVKPNYVEMRKKETKLMKDGKLKSCVVIIKNKTS